MIFEDDDFISLGDAVRKVCQDMSRKLAGETNVIWISEWVADHRTAPDNLARSIQRSARFDLPAAK